MTNNHVVDNATTIKVQLSDGRKFDAKVVGKDPRSDIALIQIQDPKNLTAIKLADSDALRVGDYTVAIGNPFGLGETVTSGIVSALGRSGLNVENYENFIQTDAAINRGNSGGALVNLNGELIGINTAILAPDGGNIGIGFAIPSNMVKNLTEQMVKYGQVKRGELGIMGTELNSELAKAMKVDAQRGAFVSQVMPGSAAAKAGIKAGDVITTLNGKAISSFAALRAQVGTMPIGSKVELGLLRDGKPVKMSKRTGQAITLNELIEEVGTDAARYFFIMRSLDTQLDFDLDLAKSHSNENPVYYIQYAHARIYSIYRQAKEAGADLSTDWSDVKWDTLTNEYELELIKKMAAFPEGVQRAARERAPHRIAHFVHELAGMFHTFYNHCRIIQEDKNLERARLALVTAVRITIANSLAILGVSAPEKM